MKLNQFLLRLFCTVFAFLTIMLYVQPGYSQEKSIETLFESHSKFNSEPPTGGSEGGDGGSR